MAKPKTGRSKKAPPPAPLLRRVRVWLWRKLRWFIIAPVVLVGILLALYTVVNPPTTHTIWSESRRLNGVDHEWLPIEQVAPSVVRAVVAAEDANFCRHWGFDMNAIRDALEDGAGRGASTISQQTVKNVFLWQGRSWFRKALEASLTPVVELVWSKRRILEIYLNIAEFDEGVFGIDAAAYHYFRKSPMELSPTEGARLAMVLPNPKGRDPKSLSPNLAKRARQVVGGAATIKADGRAACFED